MRRFTFAVLLGALVVLAGCTGAGSPDTDDQRSPTATSEGPGDGPADGGDVTLVENRTAALQAAGGYTSVWTMAYSQAGEPVGETSYTHAVDYENERSSFSMRMTDEDEVSNDYEVFHADGMSYVRYGAGEEATYQVNDAPFAPENTLFPVQSYVADADDLSAFSSVGTETYDGVTVTRYERTDRPTWVNAQAGDTNFTWTEFTYVVLVDGDGLVRSESWGGVGEDDEGVEQRMTFSYSLTAVGSTVIEEPDWAESAREQSGQ